MARNILTSQSTAEQQQQIRATRGKTISTLNIDLNSTSNLSEQEFDNVAEEVVYMKNGATDGD
ncbi:MAG: hypothetical protein ABSG32_28555 [Terriglobia bacterium]|jgi:hypothetical protein